MKRFFSQAEYILLSIWLNVLLFVLRPMTFTVFTFPSDATVGEFLRNTFGNLFLFIIAVFTVAFFFKTRAKWLTHSAFFGIFFKKVLPLSVLVRVVADGMMFLLNRTETVVTDLFGLLIETLAVWFLFYVACKSFTSKQRLSFTVRKDLVKALVLFFAFAVCGIYCVYTAGAAEHLLSKYESVYDFSLIYSFDFKMECVRLLFSVVLWSVMFWYFSTRPALQNDEKKDRKWTALVARSILFLLLFSGIVGLKFLAFPAGTVRYVGDHISDTTVYMQNNRVDCDHRTKEVIRQGDTQWQSVYKNKRVFLKHNNEIMLAFNSTTCANASGLYKKEEVYGATVYRYDFDAVAYVTEQGACRALLTRDINTLSEKDDILTLYMEQLIEQGYFEAFEYSYRYLEKFDSDFIRPYLTDAEGSMAEFSASSNNINIKPNYIAEFFDRL